MSEESENFQPIDARKVALAALRAGGLLWVLEVLEPNDLKQRENPQ